MEDKILGEFGFKKSDFLLVVFFMISMGGLLALKEGDLGLKAFLLCFK